MVTEFSAIKQQADEFVLSLPPEQEQDWRNEAVAYYIRNGLSGTPGSQAVLTEIASTPPKDRNPIQAGILSLLSANVFDFLIEAGHLDKFKQQVGL